ncbi:tubulin-tyrosine ligase family-domain-containing protein [Fomitopsis serialis]|uniref:tubulin-tyrosine ligase family-domain-containing protein n=1 Tax=Fomitopsis serialis TaxID=139415 RepID=UPI0020073E50|nr:tubulin-tyrosine ligase family-domain-containing protein [Neoantrodia serialis]KAH9937589.1 tubulin-tyrosine ligase family-domain-containing protein [Neoantrodia serialis]
MLASAPLTDGLVRRALSSLVSPPAIVDSLSEQLVSSPGNLLQWSTYDVINHDLIHLPPSGSRVLSSSYIIRKALIRKHYLSRCIRSYVTKHPDSPLQRTVPKTWDIDLSFADELDEMWSDDLYDLGLELDGEEKKWWILKPGMADRGMGIRLFHTKDELTQIFEGFEPDSDEEEDQEGYDAETTKPDTAVAASQLRHFVIQEYIAEPLLLDPLEVPLDGRPKPQPQDLHGHKFHLRVYCVASGALTVYMYTRMLALFSVVPYAAPGSSADKSTADYVNEDLTAHLTNTSLQTDHGEAGVRLFDELVGCRILSASTAQSAQARPRQPRPSRAMGEMLGAEELRAASKAQQTPLAQESEQLSAEDIEDIKLQVAEVLGETFKAALDMSVHFQALPNVFELFGIDFLVTRAESPSAKRKFQVYLLEVNSEPAIELTGPRLTWILEDLFAAIGKVCVAPFFGGAGAGTEWGVGETREALRKCLDIEVRGSRGW